MDPVAVILSALTAGAATGVTEVAGNAIKDLYSELITLISKKLNKNQKTAASLNGYLEDPETWKKPMQKAIQDAKIDGDGEILTIASRLLDIVKTQKFPSKFTITVSGNVEGVVSGDNAKVTMNFNKPVKRQQKKKILVCREKHHGDKGEGPQGSC